MNKIYQLKIYHLFESSIKFENPTVYSDNNIFLDSLENIKYYINEYRKSNDDKILYITADEYVVNSINDFNLADHIFDAEGNILQTLTINKPFVGIDEDECKYKLFDIVQFVADDELMTGIVGGLPPTTKIIKQFKNTITEDENSYTVYTFFNRNFDHLHIYESLLLKDVYPVNEEYKNKLIDELKIRHGIIGGTI